MQKINNKIVFITGASSGIGKACAEEFANAGAKLVLTARRITLLEELAEQLREKYKIEVLPIMLDITNSQQVNNVITNLPQCWQNIDILVNNAGVAPNFDKIQDGNISNWDAIIDTNIKGLLYVTHTILPGMITRKSGHIINMGSIAAHEYYQRGNVYSATKHAIKALNKSLRIDLLGLPIRVSMVDPGATATSFCPPHVYAGFNTLLPSDVADAVLYCATRPLHVNVEDIIIYPTDQASVHYTNSTERRLDVK